MMTIIMMLSCYPDSDDENYDDDNMMMMNLSQVVGMLPVVKGDELVSNEAKISRTVSTKFN